MTFKQGKERYTGKVDHIYCDMGLELYKLKIFEKNDYWNPTEDTALDNYIIDYLTEI